MKKCGSTSTAPGSKTMEELVEQLNSLSLDATTPNCQHLFMREYAYDMRDKDLRACNPFGKNTDKIWEQLRGPLDAPRFRWWRCKNCVRKTVVSRTSADVRLNAAQTSQQLCIPGPEINSSVEQRVAGDGIEGNANKTPIEVINLDDSEDERVTTNTLQQTEKRPCLYKDGNKAPVEVINLDDSDDESVTTYTRQRTEKRPCLYKGKSIMTEVQDNEQEYFRPLEKEKAKGSYPFLPSQNCYRGHPYSQSVLNELNARIARTAGIQRREQQERSNLPSSSTLDLSLSLCCPGTEANQKVGNESVSAASQGKRKRMVDAFADDSISAMKSRRLMEMGKFLGKPFSSWEIIDLKSASSSDDGSTRPVATANASHGQEIASPRMTGKEKRNTSEPSDPVTQVCLINRNPADFSEPGPDNIYMIKGEDLKFKNRRKRPDAN